MMIFFSLIFIYSVEKTCSKIWAFERIIGFTLNESADKEIKSIMLRTACQDLCLSERTFQCRSITYDYGRRLCRLFRETRRSKPNSFKLSSDHVDYFEYKCADGNYFFVFYILNLVKANRNGNGEKTEKLSRETMCVCVCVCVSLGQSKLVPIGQIGIGK